MSSFSNWWSTLQVLSFRTSHYSRPVIGVKPHYSSLVNYYCFSSLKKKHKFRLLQWQPSSFFFLLLLSARNVNEMTSLFCDVVALFRKLLCHARQWSRQLKGAYWIWSLFFLFFHGEGWRIWGAVSDSPDVFVKCCEFVLSSRVNLVSCSNSSPLSFFHWFSFFLFFLFVYRQSSSI